MHTKPSCASLAVILTVALAGRSYSPGGLAPMTLQLKSSDFASGQKIPKQFTCEGEDISPALSWNDPPAGTKSFALIVDDPDDQREGFCTRGRIVPRERGRNVLAFAGELFRDFLTGSEVGAFELEGHGCETSRRIGSAGKGYREDDGQRSAGWFGVHRGILALDGQSGNQKPKNGKGKGDTWRAAGKVALRRSRCGGRADAEEVGDHRVTAL